MKLTNSPVDSICLFARNIFIKRDDLLHPEFSGNKARKFKYFLDNELSEVQKIVAYGSCQANSLYSLSVLAKLRNWKCVYYVDRIPQHLMDCPSGNYAKALNNGAEIKLFPERTFDGDNQKEAWLISEYSNHINCLVIPEGGRCEFARHGVHELASEIHQWAINNDIKELKVFLPSGTGTTALFLQEYFYINNSSIQVLTCSVVGNDEYLIKQFMQLNSNKCCHPHVLPKPQRFHFGKLNKKLFDMWNWINQSGIEFELLYDTVGFITLQAFIDEFQSSSIMYIHQGGLVGNETMLPRYLRKYRLSIDN